MENVTNCPKCNSENIYSERNIWMCPECTHEWTTTEESQSSESSVAQDSSVKDVYGNILIDGDSVTVIKDLKIKGSSSSVKVGTKVKNIRLVEGNDGHNISCRIDGFGAMNLKSEFVKKA